MYKDNKIEAQFKWHFSILKHLKIKITEKFFLHKSK